MPVKVKQIIRREIDVPDLPQQLTQAQKKSGKSVAEICTILGFSRTYWYLITKGKEEVIAYETLLRIEEALGVSFGITFD